MNAHMVLRTRTGRLLAAGVVLFATVGSAAAATAGDHLVVSEATLTADAVADSGHISDAALADLIPRVLDELGLDDDAAAALIDEFGPAISDRMDAMATERLVSVEHIDNLTDVVNRGELHGYLSTVLREARARRHAFREAAEKALAQLGIDVGDGDSIHDVLTANDLTADDLKSLLDEYGFDLPPPPSLPAPPPDTYPTIGPHDTAPPADGTPSESTSTLPPTDPVEAATTTTTTSTTTFAPDHDAKPPPEDHAPPPPGDDEKPPPPPPRDGDEPPES